MHASKRPFHKRAPSDPHPGRKKALRNMNQDVSTIVDLSIEFGRYPRTPPPRYDNTSQVVKELEIDKNIHSTSNKKRHKLWRTWKPPKKTFAIENHTVLPESENTSVRRKSLRDIFASMGSRRNNNSSQDAIDGVERARSSSPAKFFTSRAQDNTQTSRRRKSFSDLLGTFSSRRSDSRKHKHSEGLLKVYPGLDKLVAGEIPRDPKHDVTEVSTESDIRMKTPCTTWYGTAPRDGRIRETPTPARGLIPDRNPPALPPRDLVPSLLIEGRPTEFIVGQQGMKNIIDEYDAEGLVEIRAQKNQETDHDAYHPKNPIECAIPAAASSQGHIADLARGQSPNSHPLHLVQAQRVPFSSGNRRSYIEQFRWSNISSEDFLAAHITSAEGKIDRKSQFDVSLDSSLQNRTTSSDTNSVSPDEEPLDAFGIELDNPQHEVDLDPDFRRRLVLRQQLYSSLEQSIQNTLNLMTQNYHAPTRLEGPPSDHRDPEPSIISASTTKLKHRAVSYGPSEGSTDTPCSAGSECARQNHCYAKVLELQANATSPSEDTSDRISWLQDPAPTIPVEEGDELVHGFNIDECSIFDDDFFLDPEIDPEIARSYLGSQYFDSENEIEDEIMHAAGESCSDDILLDLINEFENARTLPTWPDLGRDYLARYPSVISLGTSACGGLEFGADNGEVCKNESLIDRTGQQGSSYSSPYKSPMIVNISKRLQPQVTEMKNFKLKQELEKDIDGENDRCHHKSSVFRVDDGELTDHLSPVADNMQYNDNRLPENRQKTSKSVSTMGTPEESIELSRPDSNIESDTGSVQLAQYSSEAWFAPYDEELDDCQTTTSSDVDDSADNPGPSMSPRLEPATMVHGRTLLSKVVKEPRSSWVETLSDLNLRPVGKFARHNKLTTSEVGNVGALVDIFQSHGLMQHRLRSILPRTLPVAEANLFYSTNTRPGVLPSPTTVPSGAENCGPGAGTTEVTATAPAKKGEAAIPNLRMPSFSYSDATTEISSSFGEELTRTGE